MKLVGWRESGERDEPNKFYTLRRKGTSSLGEEVRWKSASSSFGGKESAPLMKKEVSVSRRESTPRSTSTLRKGISSLEGVDGMSTSAPLRGRVRTKGATTLYSCHPVEHKGDRPSVVPKVASKWNDNVPISDSSNGRGLKDDSRAQANVLDRVLNT